MKRISITELKANFYKIMGECARTGESFVLTRRGKPEVKVMPIVEVSDQGQVEVSSQLK